MVRTYGNLINTAYIIDAKNNIDFSLSVNILVNEDGIFSEGRYEFDAEGIPFLVQLGRETYTYKPALKTER